MDFKEFKSIRENLGVSQPRFAEMLGYKSYRNILIKEQGKAAITRQDEIILSYILRDEKKKLQTA